VEGVTTSALMVFKRDSAVDVSCQ